MPLAYSYSRLSTDDQLKNGDGRRRQLTDTRKFAAENGLTLVEEITDWGTSAFRGANLADTSPLRRFVRAVEDGAIPRDSWLLMESIDRATRMNPWDALPKLQDLLNLGITIVEVKRGRIYTQDSMRDGPMHILEMIFILSRAHEESKMKSHRISTNWARRRAEAAQHKLILTARTPGWLRVVGDTDETRKFEVIEDRAAIIREMYQMYASGRAGTELIAKTLNARGVQCFGSGSRTGRMWRPEDIRRTLNSKAPIGTIVMGTTAYDVRGKPVRRPGVEVQDYFPPIISKELDTQVKSMRVGVVRDPEVGPGNIVSMLSGLSRCALCGAAMVRVNKGRRKKPHISLVCSAAKMALGCAYHSVALSRVEQAIVGDEGMTLLALLPPASLQSGLGSIREELQQTNETVERLTDVLTAVRNDEVLTQLHRATKTRDRLRGELADLTTRRDGIRLERLGEISEMAVEAEPDAAAINAALRALFDSILIDVPQQRITMLWKTYDQTVLTWD